MVTKELKKKQNGEVFTPKELAEYLANRMTSYINFSRCHSINDPACGDGALLYALSQALCEHTNNTFSIYGSDKDADYLQKAKKAIVEAFPSNNANFECKDFIEERVNTLFAQSVQYSAIIANPPYVRTQALGENKSKAIAQMYGLKGRVDLYYPFLINMTESLEEGGIIGVITSNRYLTTKSGESIREYLLEHYDILEVIDLGDTKLFDAAVLPAIFIGRKNSKKKKIDEGSFIKIYESDSKQVAVQVASIYNVLEERKSGIYTVNGISYSMTVGRFVRPEIKSEIWKMVTDDEQEWLNVIDSHAAFKVGEKFKVRVGVKSCADDIFLNNSLYTDSNSIEDIFYSKLISQENITPWNIEENLTKVIYPHFDNEGKKDVLDITLYPKAHAFFLKYEERLKKRSYLVKSNRKWYEYWVPQNACLWKKTKLVFPDISVEPRFAIDTTGAIVNGNCYWIIADNEEDLNLLYLIEGVANSSLMSRYHDLRFNNKLYSGRRRYLTQYVSEYPIPNPESFYSQEIIRLTKQLSATHNEDMNGLLAQLNSAVNHAFSLPD